MQTRAQGVEYARHLAAESAFLQETKVESQSCLESMSLEHRDSVVEEAVGMEMANPIRSRNDELHLLAVQQPRGM